MVTPSLSLAEQDQKPPGKWGNVTSARHNDRAVVPEIEGFLALGVTNARTEGHNSVIEQVKRVACGFRETNGASCCIAPSPFKCEEPLTDRCGNKRRMPEPHAQVKAAW
jgi:hypothetical protein